jgi:hypothetical protein
MHKIHKSLESGLVESTLLGAGFGVVASLVAFLIQISPIRILVPFFMTMTDFGNWLITNISHREHHLLWGSLLVYPIIGGIIGWSYFLTEKKEGKLQAQKDAFVSIGIILLANLLLLLRNLR